MQGGVPITTATAWAIFDGKTGSFLKGKNEHMPLQKASLTKMMTAYIIVKMAELNPNVLQEIMTVSKKAASTIGTTATLREGDQVKVLDALYGLMLPSGNDAAQALAEHFGQRLPGPVGIASAATSSRSLMSAFKNSARKISAASSPRRSKSLTTRHHHHHQHMHHPHTHHPHKPNLPKPTKHTNSSSSSGSSSTSTSVCCNRSSDEQENVFTDNTNSTTMMTMVAEPVPEILLPPAERFVALMNETALDLGMRRTYYRNPHGLMAEGFHSTASDTAKLGCAAMKESLFRKLVRCKKYQSKVANVNGRPTRTIHWENTNKLLQLNGFDGLKTGVTKAAGYCLASSCVRNGRRVIVVTLGSNSLEDRWADSMRLFSYAWRSLSTVRLTHSPVQLSPERPMTVQAMSSQDHQQNTAATTSTSTSTAVHLPPLRLPRSLSFPTIAISAGSSS